MTSTHTTRLHHRSPAGGSRAPIVSPPRSRPAREAALVSALFELAAATSLLIAAHQLDGDALATTVGTTCIALLVGRATIGFVRAGDGGALCFVSLTALQLLVVVPALGDRRELTLAAALAGLGILPTIGATLPALIRVGLAEGRRDDVTPSLVAGVIGASAGVLVAISVANSIDVGDARLPTLMPYMAAGAALIGLAELLGLHRIGAGFAATPSIVAAGALAVGALLLIDPPGAAIDHAVTATAVTGGVAATAMLLSTTLATPRALVVPLDDPRDGPRLVGWLIAGLLVIAVAARLVVRRPLWVDEAEIGRLTDGSFTDTLDATRRAHAHPPLFDAIVWLSRQAFGSGDLALRVPSLLAGVLLVPAVYVTAEKLYDRRVGVLSAAVAAVGPGFLWISGTAGPAALTALLATLSVLTYVMARDRGQLTQWLLFGVCTTALLWTHQLGVVHVAVLHVAAALALLEPARRCRTYIVGWALALVMNAAGFIALTTYRDGVGRRDVLPPFEYATRGAPGAGRSVFGLVGAGLNGLVGFHPSDVTSRLLALWPMCILATFVFFCRSWSRRGALLLALALAPFAALLVLQIAGAPRDPPFAVSWVATALPMLAIGLGRALSLPRRWSTSRLLGAIAVAALVAAGADQAARADPVDRFAVAPAIDETAKAGRGDVVVYAPESLGDLVRRRVDGATVVTPAAATAEALAHARRVYVLGAFGFADDPSLDRVLDLVHSISADRRLIVESEHHEAKVWIFE